MRFPARDGRAAADHRLLTGKGSIGDRIFRRTAVTRAEDQRLRHAKCAAADQNQDIGFQPRSYHCLYGMAGPLRGCKWLLLCSRIGVTAIHGHVEVGRGGGVWSRCPILSAQCQPGEQETCPSCQHAISPQPSICSKTSSTIGNDSSQLSGRASEISKANPCLPARRRFSITADRSSSMGR